ncbi:hypothetical protein NL676_035315 [Syzygium grande]|nr:hypothetical protein NL676_035315 [Syzygium grande]
MYRRRGSLQQLPIRRHRQPPQEVPRWELLVRLPAPIILEVERIAHRIIPELRGRNVALPPAPPNPRDYSPALVPDLRQRELLSRRKQPRAGRSSRLAAVAVVAVRGGGSLTVGGSGGGGVAVVEAAEEEASGG